MSEKNIPCRNPKLCNGVKTHRPGTVANCLIESQKSAGGSASSNSALNSSPGLASAPEQEYLHDVDRFTSNATFEGHNVNVDLGDKFPGVRVKHELNVVDNEDGTYVESYSTTVDGGTDADHKAASDWLDENDNDYNEFVNYKFEELISSGLIEVEDQEVDPVESKMLMGEFRNTPRRGESGFTTEEEALIPNAKDHELADDWARRIAEGQSVAVTVSKSVGGTRQILRLNEFGYAGDDMYRATDNPVSALIRTSSGLKVYAGDWGGQAHHEFEGGDTRVSSVIPIDEEGTDISYMITANEFSELESAQQLATDIGFIDNIEGSDTMTPAELNRQVILNVLVRRE